MVDKDEQLKMTSAEIDAALDECIKKLKKIKCELNSIADYLEAIITSASFIVWPVGRMIKLAVVRIRREADRL
jgi:hypothetical protein